MPREIGLWKSLVGFHTEDDINPPCSCCFCMFHHEKLHDVLYFSNRKIFLRNFHLAPFSMTISQFLVLFHFFMLFPMLFHISQRHENHNISPRVLQVAFQMFITIFLVSIIMVMVLLIQVFLNVIS